MKVLLVNPPRDNEMLGNNPSIVEEERGFNPPLGLLYVAGYLEKYTSHDITVIDCQVDRLDYATLRKKIGEIKADVVGLTAMTMTLIDVIKTINLVKDVYINTKVVLGGPHVYLFPKETIALKNVDYAVLGEGEETFKKLLDNICDNAKLKTIRGLAFKDNGKVVITGQAPWIENLDDIPFPSRRLVPYTKYSSLLSKKGKITTIISSRGCPFRCSFCDRPHLGNTFRAQSASRVVDEIEECLNLGIKEFLFYDDTFTVNKQRVLDICKEIGRREIKIGWDIRARVDTIDEEMLSSLKEAGCQGIHYGVESGTDKILEVLKKGIIVKQIKQTFDLTRRYKIPILAYLMIGSPGETEKDIEQTFKLMKELKADYVHITIFTPFPGTKLYHHGLESGVIKHDYWKEFAQNPTNDFVVPHWGENFTKEELTALLVKGYKLFYMRPSYVLKSIGKVRSFGEFGRKVVAGAKVFVAR